MLDIDFKAPVEVTITFDDSDDEEIKDFKKEIATEDFSPGSESVEITNKNVTQLDNQKDEEISQKSDTCQNSVPSKSTVTTKKRKLESSLPADNLVENNVKHTIVTNTHGTAHIIVAPPTNSNPSVDETKKINQYLDNSLKTISEHLILIIQAYHQFSALENGLEVQARQHFMSVKNYFYNLSYSAVVSIMVPQENDILFVTKFLKDTLRLCKEKNIVNITNEEQIFPFYSEMLDWAKKNQKSLPEFKFLSDKERNQTNVSNKSAQKKNHSNRNTSDDRNAHLRALLNPEKTKSFTHVPSSSKHNTIPYCNTNIPNILYSPNGHGNTSGQTNASSASVIPGISNNVTNAFPSNSTVTYDYAHYNNLCQNQNLQVRHSLSQMTPSGSNLFHQSQGPRVIPSAQSSYQQSQYNLSQMKHISQNPYIQPHMQQGLAQTQSRGFFPNMMNNFQNVHQSAIHTHINPNNFNTNAATQLPLREDGIGLNNSRTDLNRGNVLTHIPVPKATYQNNDYIQSRTDQQMQWPQTRPPPPYEKTYNWQNHHEQKSVSKEQQPTQAAPAAQSTTPVAQWQHQVEPQPLEVTRSMSTDSGIVSPLPFINTTGATNSYNTEEEQPTPFITHVTSLNPNVSYNNEGKCSVCSKTTKLKCLCLEKYYCSYVCQEADWNNHSMICSTQKTLNRLAH